MEGARNRVARELAIEISLASLGSSHTLRSPQLSTEAASRFCNFRDTMSVPTAAAPAELSQRGSSSVAHFTAMAQAKAGVGRKLQGIRVHKFCCWVRLQPAVNTHVRQVRRDDQRGRVRCELAGYQSDEVSGSYRAVPQRGGWQAQLLLYLSRLRQSQAAMVSC